MAYDTGLPAALRTTGHRLTRQRLLIMEVLEESNEHLDANTLFSRVHARDATISLSTVYRALSMFKEIGLVEVHQLGEEHAHFEAVQDAPHYHFICSVCGRVIEFDAPQVLEAIRDLSRRAGLKVTSSHLLLSGLCPECRLLERDSREKGLEYGAR